MISPLPSLSPPVKIPSSALLALVLSAACSIFIFDLLNCFRGLVLHTAGIDTLEEVLKTSSIESVERTLEYLDHTRREREFLGIFGEPTSAAEQREELIRVALTLRSALIAENRAEIRVAITEISRAFLSRHSFTGGLAEELVNIQRLLSDHLQEHQKIISSISKSAAEQKRILEERSLLHIRYDLIEGDLNELFSLTLRANPHRGEIIFYQSGVLAGLPMIADIRDGLESLVDLRSELERVGGRVRVAGDDAHRVFVEQLAQIKEQSREIFERYNQLENDRKAAAESVHWLKEERRDKRKHLITTINHLIILLAAH